MTDKAENPDLGSILDDFLKEEGIYEEATIAAIKYKSGTYGCFCGFE